MHMAHPRNLIAAPLDVTDARLHAKHMERRAAARNCSVHTSDARRGALPHQFRRVTSDANDRSRPHAADGHLVVLGAARGAFICDEDAARDTVAFTVNGDKVDFPLQAGAIWWPDTNDDANHIPIGCTCEDWKYRGTDSAETATPGTWERTQASVRNSTKSGDRLMGALRGCKHMIAVALRANIDIDP